MPPWLRRPPERAPVVGGFEPVTDDGGDDGPGTLLGQGLGVVPGDVRGSHTRRHRERRGTSGHAAVRATYVDSVKLTL